MLETDLCHGHVACDSMPDRKCGRVGLINTLRPRQNGRHLAEDISKYLSCMKIYEFCKLISSIIWYIWNEFLYSVSWHCVSDIILNENKPYFWKNPLSSNENNKHCTHIVKILQRHQNQIQIFLSQRQWQNYPVKLQWCRDILLNILD